MQTKRDKQNLIKLGVQKDTIHTPGNLKYDTALYSTDQRNQPLSFVLPEHKLLIIAGSTHPGEEEILLKSYLDLKIEFPDSYLIIAPRNIDSAAHIHALAQSLNLSANRRSQINARAKDLFILDTIGELNKVYSHADIAFVGGSLVAKGGHNPIEPAIFSVPVLFGHHMEDFSEISRELIQAGGGIMVQNQTELTAKITELLQDPDRLHESGRSAKICITAKQGVIDRHLHLIKEML
jgi:3-deoxy-D-manno-octulosonic-acid transferase